MTLQERKEDLLKHSAHEVRNSRTLFAEFVFIYTQEGGNERDCMSCNFKNVFNRWQRGNSKFIKKEIVMSNNTFKLKNPNEIISIPKGLGVITKNSPDELVETFLNQDDGKNRENRIKRFFEKTPDGKKKAEEIEVVSEVEVKKPKTRKKRTPKAK